MNFLPVRIQFLILITLLHLGGCAENKRAEFSNEREYVDIAQQFGEFLMRHDYRGAYDLTSTALKKHMNYEAFVDDCERARGEYGEILKVESTVNSTDRAMLKSEGFEWPKNLSPDSLRAWMVTTLGVELDEKGEIYRCYDYWLVLVDEDGQTKVGHFYHAWCD